jgi:hypothetical protein
MATVHPSRMAFIPPEAREVRHRPRSPTPPYRSRRSPSRSRSRSRSHERGQDRRSRYRQDERNDGGRGGRERDRDRDRDREDRRRERSRERGRRASPEYAEYRRPSPPPPSRDEGNSNEKPPWHQAENMYPNKRGERDRYQEAGVRRGGTGTDFLERYVPFFSFFAFFHFGSDIG